MSSIVNPPLFGFDLRNFITGPLTDFNWLSMGKSGCTPNPSLTGCKIWEEVNKINLFFFVFAFCKIFGFGEVDGCGRFWFKCAHGGTFQSLQVSRVKNPARKTKNCHRKTGGHFGQVICWNQISHSNWQSKHCQRHNGSEGWVLVTKVTSFGHFTSSQTNLDQISSS